MEAAIDATAVVVTSAAKVELPEPGRRQRQLEGRLARAREAQEAAERRAARSKAENRSILVRVEKAQKLLDRPLAQARALLDDLCDTDLQVYLLAETLGKNRKGVLQGYPPPSRSVREAYEQESGLDSPSADS